MVPPARPSETNLGQQKEETTAHRGRNHRTDHSHLISSHLISASLSVSLSVSLVSLSLSLSLSGGAVRLQARSSGLQSAGSSKRALRQWEILINARETLSSMPAAHQHLIGGCRPSPRRRSISPPHPEAKTQTKKNKTERKVSH